VEFDVFTGGDWWSNLDDGVYDIQRNLIAEQLLSLPRHRGVLDRRS